MTRPVFISMRLGLLAAMLLLSGSAVRAEGLDAMKARVRRKFPEVVQWTTAQTAEALRGEEPPLVLDIREPAEFAVSHLADARRLSPAADPSALLKSLPSGRQILVYCSVGYRSAKMARRIRRQGHLAVANLEGGIFQWANEGRPLLKEEAPVESVHGYNSRWSRYLMPEKRVLP